MNKVATTAVARVADAETSSKTKWQVKREASYEALVDAAMHVFHDRGYAATRVEDIAAAAGYTSGAFYQHFRHKQDCFWHVLEHRVRLRGDWSAFVEALDPSTTDLESVVKRAFALLAASMPRVEAWVLVMVEFSQQHRAEAAVKKGLHDYYDRWHDELGRFVRRLHAGGWLAPDANADLLTTEIFAFAQGMTVHGRVFGLDEKPQQLTLVDGITRILRAPRS